MSEDFLQSWHTAARTSAGLFWMAFWAFGFGYLVSSAIQVFVTQKRMQETMGETGPKSILLGTFFGFISSSCSFAALSTTRAILVKGAGLIPSLAFLLASTNLVIELGIVIAVFLSWQFVVGEYVGGVLLILLMWLVVKVTQPEHLAEQARDNAEKEDPGPESDDSKSWRELIRTKEGWTKVGNQYLMEWGMVWKDVTVGFTAAGIIATFVPERFFQSLFMGSGGQDPSFSQVFMQALVGPVAAFFTFIGSMGNIPLAAVLFSNGVSFAGIMAFIFSDLVVFPVLRIQAKYYGWKMALYILAVFLIVLVTAAILMHYGFAAAGALPDSSQAQSVTDRDFFGVDYTSFLNIVFLVVSGFALARHLNQSGFSIQMSTDLQEITLFYLALAAYLWIAGGLLIPLF